MHTSSIQQISLIVLWVSKLTIWNVTKNLKKKMHSNSIQVQILEIRMQVVF